MQALQEFETILNLSMKGFFFTFLKNLSPDQLLKEVRSFPVYLSLMFVHHLLKFLETQWAVSNKFDTTRDLKHIGPWTFYNRKGRPKFWSPQKQRLLSIVFITHQKVHKRNQQRHLILTSSIAQSNF